MATPPAFDLDVVAISSAASGVAPSNLTATIAIVQDASATSRERVVTVEAMS
jgi:hypothetical protein